MHKKVYHTRSSNVKWTSEMDLCLSKLLADHAKRDYRSDNIIKPATYAAAVATLNKRFGLELTKENLKNRLKTWKRQYAILKEIVASKGFKWDKAKKMVIATDAVWNAYVKLHPDAKGFRAKSIENYDDLCIIVGNARAIASSSDDGIEVDVDVISDNEIVETAIDSEIQTDDKVAKNLRWTKQMDTWMGKILVEQILKGRKVDNVMQSEAYDVAVVEMNKKFGPGLTRDNIRNRLKTLKRQFRVMEELLSNGFKWDESLKMIIGSDTQWNDYIKVHNEARGFRGRIIENYDCFNFIFAKNDASDSSRTVDNLLHSLVVDSEAMEAIDASPIQYLESMKDHVKDMRWTNEMDCCLSTILAEQVKLGNKSNIDHRFKPAAYDAAVIALNEKFDLDIAKDHIANWIKAWKKVCGNLRELLIQSDFKWDKKQKMVIANDSVWDNYIKINPDVRILQGRVIESYENLCLVFGDDAPIDSAWNDDEIYLDLAADNGIEAFVYGNQSNNRKEKGKYIIWTDEMDRCFYEKLIEQLKLGNMYDKNLKSMAYAAALTSLHENFLLDLTKDNIRNRLKTWKKLYGLVSELLSSREFEWDERRNMILANESAWNVYLESNPDARFLRERSIESYDELLILISNSYPNGCWSVTGAKAEVNPTLNNGNPLLPNMAMDEETSKDNNTGEGTQVSSQQTGARPSSSSRSKQPSKKRRSSSDTMIEMMGVMATNIGRIADALTGNSRSACMDEVFEMVQSIPGLDDDLIIEACEFLSFDEKRAKMFMKLDDRLRKLWLLKRVRGDS